MSNITTTEPRPIITETDHGGARLRRGHDPASPLPADTPVGTSIWRRRITADPGRTTGAQRRRRWTRWLGLALALGFVIALIALSTPPADLSVSEAPVVGFDGGETSFGSSTLVRHDDSIEGWVHTAGLAPDEAVTLWWVIFNEPSACTPPACDGDDIFVGGDPSAGSDHDRIEAADVVVGFAAGGVVRDGAISLAFALDEGEAVPDRQIGVSPGLRSARGAEVHLVVRSHGPAGSELDRQLSTFDGGCTVSLVPPARPSAAGECGDVQFSIHRPEGSTS